MGVFGASGRARTFDFRAGDVRIRALRHGHYVENTGTGPLRFLEVFKSSYHADLSLDMWMAKLVEAHLKVDQPLRNNKTPIVPV
jgi:oxalate decarboxylase